MFEQRFPSAKFDEWLTNVFCSREECERCGCIEGTDKEHRTCGNESICSCHWTDSEIAEEEAERRNKSDLER